MKKEAEILLLDSFITQAREQNADYLYDALMALTGHFEAAVRSDFPGEIATHNLIKEVRALRAEKGESREELEETRRNKEKLKSEARQKEFYVQGAKTQLAEINVMARKLAEYTN
jgi:hypothetical protein